MRPRWFYDDGCEVPHTEILNLQPSDTFRYPLKMLRESLVESWAKAYRNGKKSNALGKVGKKWLSAWEEKAAQAGWNRDRIDAEVERVKKQARKEVADLFSGYTNSNDKSSRIKVDYDGSYPNLCSGDLLVTIDGKTWEFPPYCLKSGGRVWFDDDWEDHVEEGDWEIKEWPEGFPEDLKADALAVVNEVIPHGCCGGCV